MSPNDNLFMTPGSARPWARRLRKLGFSPVTLHCDSDGTVTGHTGAYYLRCNWPYDVAVLPLDLYEYIAGEEYTYSEVMWVASQANARGMVRMFRKVRAGMGARPIPRVERRRPEPLLVPAERIHPRVQFPRGTQRHPDYMPESSL
jgi:hypothetical protein